MHRSFLSVGEGWPFSQNEQPFEGRGVGGPGFAEARDWHLLLDLGYPRVQTTMKLAS